MTNRSKGQELAPWQGSGKGACGCARNSLVWTSYTSGKIAGDTTKSTRSSRIASPRLTTPHYIVTSLADDRRELDNGYQTQMSSIVLSRHSGKRQDNNHTYSCDTNAAITSVASNSIYRFGNDSSIGITSVAVITLLPFPEFPRWNIVFCLIELRIELG